MASRKNKPTSVPGKVAGSAFFFFFLLIGLIFISLLFKNFMAGESARKWPSVHGTLTRVQIAVDENSKEPFTVVGGYEYTVLGKDYTSERIQFDTPSFSSYRKADQLMQKIIKANPLKVYYDHEDPQQAILIQSSRWEMLFLLLPLLFIVIGLGGIIAMWVRGSPGSRKKSISRKALKKKSGGWFFAIFFLAGVGFLMVFLIPAKSSIEAMSWPEVPCTIHFSELRSYQSDDGTTYKADIFYSYTIEDKVHYSNQVEFMGGSSSGAESKRKRLRQYPPNSRKVCYVDPDDPTRAVLIRGFTGIYFFALIPLLFVCIGGAGMIHQFKGSHEDHERTSLRQPKWEPKILESGGEVTLKAGQPRWAGFLFLTVFAVFWNGVVFGFLVPDVIGDLKRGSGGFMVLFSVPFVLVGVGVAVGAGVMLLKLFNPRAVIVLKPATASPGDTITLSWQLKGGIKPLEELTLTFFGQEKATYRRGTNTYHDHHRFHEHVLFQGSRQLDIQTGELTHTLPADLMPTFDAGNNKIQWFVEVKGVIRQWPDLKAQYELILHPRGSRS